MLALAAPLLLAAEKVALKQGDVVAFVGGGDVAAAQHTGHLESLLTAAFPRVHFRNFGWEGDTVFAQPRDFNFPPTREHLRKHAATVIVVQFGRMEAFVPNGAREFRAACERMLDDFARITPRLVLVTPIPFERPSEPVPDVSERNDELAEIARIIRDVAKERTLPVVDLYSELSGTSERMTGDGLQLTPKGHAIVARAFARQLGIQAPESDVSINGEWKNPNWEKLRQLVIQKNWLWFHYWRPQNWAFLGGDRIEQPSSRDHRDPKIRWFPKEIEEFNALIAAKESEIANAALSLGANSR